MKYYEMSKALSNSHKTMIDFVINGRREHGSAFKFGGAAIMREDGKKAPIMVGEVIDGLDDEATQLAMVHTVKRETANGHGVAAVLCFQNGHVHTPSTKECVQDGLHVVSFIPEGRWDVVYRFHDVDTYETADAVFTPAEEGGFNPFTDERSPTVEDLLEHAKVVVGKDGEEHHAINIDLEVDLDVRTDIKALTEELQAEGLARGLSEPNPLPEVLRQNIQYGLDAVLEGTKEEGTVSGFDVVCVWVKGEPAFRLLPNVKATAYQTGDEDAFLSIIADILAHDADWVIAMNSGAHKKDNALTVIVNAFERDVGQHVCMFMWANGEWNMVHHLLHPFGLPGREGKPLSSIFDAAQEQYEQVDAVRKTVDQARAEREEKKGDVFH